MVVKTDMKPVRNCRLNRKDYPRVSFLSCIKIISLTTSYLWICRHRVFLANERCVTLLNMIWGHVRREVQPPPALLLMCAFITVSQLPQHFTDLTHEETQ